jgi:hypothetical protein
MTSDTRLPSVSQTCTSSVGLSPFCETCKGSESEFSYSAWIRIGGVANTTSEIVDSSSPFCDGGTKLCDEGIKFGVWMQAENVNK